MPWKNLKPTKEYLHNIGWDGKILIWARLIIFPIKNVHLENYSIFLLKYLPTPSFTSRDAFLLALNLFQLLLWISFDSPYYLKRYFLIPNPHLSLTNLILTILYKPFPYPYQEKERSRVFSWYETSLHTLHFAHFTFDTLYTLHTLQTFHFTHFTLCTLYTLRTLQTLHFMTSITHPLADDTLQYSFNASLDPGVSMEQYGVSSFFAPTA